MSLAHDMSRYEQAAAGSAAYALPEPERAQRPGTRAAVRPKRRSRRGLVLGVAGWVCIMAVSMALVQRNTMVLAETAAVTTIRADLAQVQKENQELEDKLTSDTSVEAITRWAEAHQMQRAAQFRTLKGEPTAVANSAEEAPAAVEAPPAPAAQNWLQSIKAYLAALAQGHPTAQAAQQ